MEENGFLSKLMRVINKAGNAIMLNLLFLVTCIPVVTIGPAWCGLISAVRFEIRGDKWFDGFKAGVRTRFLRSMIAGVLGYALALYFANNAIAGINALIAGAGGWFSTVFSCVMAIAVVLILTASLAVNVFFGRDVDTWLDYAFLLIAKAPIQVFISTVLMWIPIALFLYDTLLFLYVVMVFIAAYFVMCGVVMTGLMKNGLLKVLYKDRANFPQENKESEV